MRKLRAVIIDDEPFVRHMLRDFFLLRGYDVLSYSDAAMVCPLYGEDGDLCTNEQPCSDVLLTDFNMPGLNGVELLQHQKAKGCKLDKRNKAVISGYIDEVNRQAIDAMGCVFFQKPFPIVALSAWLAACEQRADLAKPLATRRREERFASCCEMTFRIAQTNQVVTGVAVNISHSGLCLKVPARLRHSDIIRFQDCPFTSWSEASVRWVSSLGKDAYMAGLQFLAREQTAARRPA